MFKVKKLNQTLDYTRLRERNLVQRNVQNILRSDYIHYLFYDFSLTKILKELQANKMLTGLAITSFLSSRGANEQ